MIRKHFFRQYGPKSETGKPLHGMILKPLQWCCRIPLYIYIYSLNHKKNKKAVGIFVCTENKDSTVYTDPRCDSLRIVTSSLEFFLLEIIELNGNFSLVTFDEMAKIQLVWNTSWCCIPQAVWNMSPLQHFDSWGVGGWIQFPNLRLQGIFQFPMKLRSPCDPPAAAYLLALAPGLEMFVIRWTSRVDRRAARKHAMNRW